MNSNITSWLEHLRVLFPPTGVVQVGAGTGTGEWVQRLLQWDVANVTLIEADDTQFLHLQRTITREDWHLCKQLIAGDTGPILYHQASSAAESGLLEPEKLRSIWPNLKTVQKQAREAITLADLLQDVPIPVNWLLIDCMPALTIVQGAAEQLSAFDIVVARVLLNDALLLGASGGLAELERHLSNYGYRCVVAAGGRHPSIGHAVYVRDTQATIVHLQKQLVSEQRRYEAETQARANDRAQLTQSIIELQHEIQRISKANATLLGQLQPTKVFDKDHFEINQLAGVRSGLESSNTSGLLSMHKDIEELKGSVKTQSSEFDTRLHHLSACIADSFKKEISNATKQIEAFLNVQNYLNTGELGVSMHGWPISPDFAHYLLELLESNDYDLVIEFGSGVSTLLVAKTLAKINPRRKDKPKAIQIAFEHLDQYRAKTFEFLQRAELSESVQLFSAPLQPFSDTAGNNYSYYSCREALEKIFKASPKVDLRILILVDGPPGRTNKHARYPALPHVLAHFAQGKIDILLDDYCREDEKEVTEMWLSEIRAAGLIAQLTELDLEKGACLVTISKKVPGKPPNGH